MRIKNRQLPAALALEPAELDAITGANARALLAR
jgi:hypothetical protein